jgi:hypothetical protein
MMLMGAFGAAIGTWASGSALAGVGLALVSGAAIGLIVAIVTVRYRADNTVTGVTANILAAGLTSYLLRALSGGGRPIAIHLTPLAPWLIPGLSNFPIVGPLLFALPPLTYLAIAGCVALSLFFSHTQFGLILRDRRESRCSLRLRRRAPARADLNRRRLWRDRRPRRRGPLAAAGRHVYRRHDRRPRLPRFGLAHCRALEPARRGGRLAEAF